jgi:hypothetical protein
LLRCSLVAQGLQPATLYEIEVATRNLVASSYPQTLLYTTVDAAPDGPPGLEVASATSDSITFQWNTPAGNGEPVVGYVLALSGQPPLLLALRSDGSLAQLGGAPMRRRRRLGLAEDCSAILSYALANFGVASGPPASSVASYTVTNLSSGVQFMVELTACNELGPSYEPSCICASEVCTGYSGSSCNSTGVPPLTLAAPARPSPVKQDEDPKLLRLKTTSLFLQWERPFSNGRPILLTELTVGQFTYKTGNPDPAYSLPLGATELNITGLAPASQFATQVRMYNERGWSLWSYQAFQCTQPTGPEPPAMPTCDDRRSTWDSLFVNLQDSLDGNGLTSTELNYYLTEAAPDADGRFTTIYAPATPIVIDQADPASSYSFNVTNASIVAYTNGAYALKPDTLYRVVSRVRNSLDCAGNPEVDAAECGWSDWSVSSQVQEGAMGLSTACRTLPMPVPPFNLLLYVIMPLIVLLTCLCIAGISHYRANIEKVMGPKLRRKKVKEDPLSDFVSSEATMSEEHDPELVLNPVLVAKMQFEKDAARGRKNKMLKAKGISGGRSGGLARLGITLSEKPDSKYDRKTMLISSVDDYLTSKDVADTSKELTKEEKAAAARQLKKGVKTAVGKTAEKAEKSSSSALNRAKSRQAMHTTLEEEDDDDDEGGGKKAMGKSRKSVAAHARSSVTDSRPKKAADHSMAL